mgnify:CR=1 FL=1
MNENVKEYCKRWNGKVNVIEREFDLPSGQYTQMYADMITGHTIPKKVLMMEPDMVWDKEQLKKALELTDPEISFKQIEFWKNEEWYIKRTRERLTGKGTASNQRLVNNNIYCYNYGFCLSKEVMKYKFEVAIQSSKHYKDSIPSKDWYEKKWLNWTPETEDLEMSEAHKHYIKKALPYGTKD